jgi:hypothetical protein
MDTRNSIQSASIGDRIAGAKSDAATRVTA